MKTAISVPDAIFNEVDKVAKESHSSRSEVFVTAVREYLEKRKSRKLLDDLNKALAVAETEEEYAGQAEDQEKICPGGAEGALVNIKQGDVYWIDLDEPKGSEPGFRRPYVVVQNNIFNKSRINTVIVCSLTSNVKRAGMPGNVLLKKGEANLQKESVVNVTQIATVDRLELAEKIGTLSSARVHQIIAGLKLVIEPKEI